MLWVFAFYFNLLIYKKMWEKTHTITSVTPLFDDEWVFYWCKVRARSDKNEQYGQSKTYSVKDLKNKFKIENAESCKTNLLNKKCRVTYDLEF